MNTMQRGIYVYRIIAFMAAASLSVPLAAPALGQAQPVADSAPEPIVVTGERAEQAKAAGKQGQAITQRPLEDYPLARRYAPLCLYTFGINREAGEVLAERITANAQVLGLRTGGKGCKPNAWIGFVRNSKAAVVQLRKTQPEMFGTLQKTEIDRIFGGSGAAQVWHTTEQRTIDGRALTNLQIGDTTVKSTSLYQPGRLGSPIRSDILGSIVIFDMARVGGKSLLQLADYATFRILAQVQDLPQVAPQTLPSILTLFAEQAETAPDGLTEFDWAYLAGFYRMERGARSLATSDATERAMLDGTATRLSVKGRPD
ncbi:MAG: hypothetical protein RL339_1965 [Pseudomonadota bacterium]